MATSARTASERAPLSPDRVFEAGIALADAHGLEALTMRRLAQELGVEAMSLYHHVANKDELLDGMLDRVLGSIDLADAGTDWKAGIWRTAMSANQVLFAHPWAANLALSGPHLSDARIRYMDHVLGTLRRGGFTAEEADHAYHAIDGHIMGFTLWEIGITTGLARLEGGVPAFLETFDGETYPWMAEHIQEHLRAEEQTDEFAFALGLVLDGLERRQRPRATRRTRSP
jgi:AcrR family transcriptional regulator